MISTRYSCLVQTCNDRTFQITTSWPRGHKTRHIYPHKCKFRPIRWLECVPHLRSGPSQQKHHKTVYSRRHSHFLSPRSKTEDFIVFHANTRCVRMSGFFYCSVSKNVPASSLQKMRFLTLQLALDWT